MAAKQRPKFVLKAQLAMVLFLPGNVLLDLRQLGLAGNLRSRALAPGATDWTRALIPLPIRLE